MINRLLFHPKRYIQNLFSIILILIGLIQVSRLAFIIFTVGENNLSNDYLGITNIIIRLMNNHFVIGDLGQYCFRWQCEPLLVFITAFLASISHWNIYVEIMFSIVVAFVTALLVYLSVAGIRFHPKNLILFAYISAFTFSFTEISTFTFGLPALYTTIAFLGLCLGLFSVKFLADTNMGIFLLILGMWISAWSYGAGLLSIPILFVGLMISFRKNKFYFFWAISLFLISIPYIQYYLYHSSSVVSAHIQLYLFNRIDWIAKFLGLFFSNGITSTYPITELVSTKNPIIFGYFGLFFLALGILFLFRLYGIRKLYLFFFELGLIAFGLGTVIQISIVREGVAPWYISNTVPFWIGLICLYYSLIKNGKVILKNALPVKVCLALLLSSMLILFVNSNVIYEDKIFHLMTRAPVSASCLRNYQTAPSYCEQFLFQWGLGNPVSIAELGRPLQENGLSVFSPVQEWSLQGDFILNSVSISPSVNGENPHWINNAGQISSWTDYHRLNLALPLTSSIEWILDIPDNLTDGKFSTEVAVDSSSEELEKDNSNNINLKIEILSLDKGEKVVQQIILIHPNSKGRTPVELPVEAYKGRRIKILITSSAKAENFPVELVLKYPVVRLLLHGVVPAISNEYHPENVIDTADKSNIIPFFPLDPNVLTDVNQTAFVNLLVDYPNRYFSQKQGVNGYISFQPQEKFCLDDNTKFYFTIGVDKHIANRYSRVVFGFTDFEGRRSFGETYISLLPDSELHTYVYPLKLLIPSSPIYLTSLEITPLENLEMLNYKVDGMGFLQFNSLGKECYSVQHK